MKPSRQSQQQMGRAHEKHSGNYRLLLLSVALCLVLAAASALCEPASAAPKGAGQGGRSSLQRQAGGAPEKPQTNSEGDNLALPTTQAVRSVSRSTPVAAVAATKPQLQSASSNAKVQSATDDMQSAAGHHYGKSHGDHGKYYMYAESPKKGSYKAGFKRGNHKHMIERKEWQHKSHAGGYMKWHGKKGKGSHKWEFKHYDKKGKHHY